MIGIVFATEMEVLPFLEAVDPIVVRRAPFLLFKPLITGILPCIVIISGIGKVAAAAATVELIIEHKVQFILNVGVCGALKDNLPLGIGGLYRISTVYEGDRSLSLVNDIKVLKCVPFFNSLEEATLVSSDRSIFNNELRHEMSLIADLVDMEGAAIIRVADMYGVSCDIMKGISDLASDGCSEIMKFNLTRVSSALSNVLLKFLRS